MKKKLLFLVLLVWTLAGANAQTKKELLRVEYPRPQFERLDWINLNGEWSYTFDFGKSGKARQYPSATSFDGKIRVPFAPQSKLSGVGYTDFIENMWYQRPIDIPACWEGKRVMLHFGAVDYMCELYLDGHYVDRHFGGSSSFSFDITSFVKAGNRHNLVLYVNDEDRSGRQTGGKQSGTYYSEGCLYTRTTGIWQTVWMEAIAPFGLKSIHVVPDLDQKLVRIQPTFMNESSNHRLRITLKDGTKTVAMQTITANNTTLAILPIAKVKAWSPESLFLYDIVLEVIDGQKQVIDRVYSYVGIRKISIEGQQVMLNNEPYFQRLVLDQGYYPDGVWTAPSDEALKQDILLSKQAGFNGARLHQKVFEERFHYWADKLGYLTWGEEASWQMDVNNRDAQRNFFSEWTEVIMRDRNHPSIVAWTPMNETWHPDRFNYPRFMKDLYLLTKGLDPTRPMIGASGGSNFLCDIYTAHCYEQNPERMRQIMEPQPDGTYYCNIPNNFDKNNKLEPFFLFYDGKMPYFVDEFGGVKWTKDQDIQKQNNDRVSWGYGDSPQTKEEFYIRLEGLVDALLEEKHIWGYCYTQLTDVEQEQNGIYYYDRLPKVDMKRIHAIFSKTKVAAKTKE